METLPEHPRTVSWLGASALAMGGSNQSLFLVGALVASQGSAAVPLLVVGLVLSWMALPGWIELVLMWPKRVGGISASCAEAFRPYSPVLANLTGVCYWWGWIPTCGLTALLSAAALHSWFLPFVEVKLLATLIICAFVAVNLAGVRWVSRLAIPIAFASAVLAFLSVLVPVWAGTVDWHQASSFDLEVPFSGPVGYVTSAMAGLYLIGFAAPAFEAAACHVGEMRDPVRSLPKAMYASAGMASLYFVVVPVVWLGTIGAGGLEGELSETLGPTFAPLLGGAAKAAALSFMVMNMFHGTLQPLAGAARTLSQLADDGLLPRVLSRRNRNDAPIVATLATAAMSIAFLQTGNPPWVLAAANFCYLIAIGLPSIAVWLLRRDEPLRARPYRAPRGFIGLGVLAAAAWALSTVLGFQQFGLPTVISGLCMAYTGSALFAWRTSRDRRASGVQGPRWSLHVKLTGAMLLVLVLDGAGYLLAVSHVPQGEAELIAILADIFVVVAMLTVSVGLVLPGMISHSVSQVAAGADRLARGTLSDLTRALEALAVSNHDAAHARVVRTLVDVHSADEVGQMAASFNHMQEEVGRAALALDRAREGLRETEGRLERTVAQQAGIAQLGQLALEDPDVERTMQELVDMVGEVLDADLVGLVQPGGSAGFYLRTAGGPRAAGLARLTVVRGPVVPHEVVRDEGFSWVDPMGTTWAEGGIALPVPGPGADDPFGTLSCAWAQAREVDPGELDFLRAAVNVLAETVNRNRVEEAIRLQALHDPLTGLPNRSLYLDRLRLALAGATRRGSAPVVLFLDLDRFKLVNDSLGHAAGDELLRQVAGRLELEVRPGDTVARFGGDEFVVLCDPDGTTEPAEDIADRLLDALHPPFVLSGGQELRVRGSVGIAIGGPGCDAEELVREADAAMYRAKELGRGRAERYDEVMRGVATSRLRVEQELSRVLERDELRLQLQPIVELSDGRILGFEALVRWEHPERGLVAPDAFIQVAEESGLIVPIGAWVLQEACAQAVRWSALAPGRAPFVSVNLSLVQVTRPGLVTTIATALATTGLPAEQLHLEITESVLMRDGDHTLEVLDALRDLGVVLVLDDFGTGYSSLAYVQRFPVAVLKVDRSFVADLEEATEEGVAIVDAILQMARGLRVEVVAEGIERRAQVDVLRRLGCERGQGFYFARPMEPAEAEDLVRADGAYPHLVS